MLVLKGQYPLSELLKLDSQFSAEQWLEMRSLWRPLIVFQEHPDILIHTLAGTYLPPHERTILRTIHLGAGETIIIGSRGTAKTSAAALYMAATGAVLPRRTSVWLAATGFRGGQTTFLDLGRWLKGGWDSQEQEVPFVRASIPRTPDPLNKSQNFWSIEFDSFSRAITLPTKDEDAIRGNRGNDLYLDEANFFQRELIDRVAIPFLNVKSDMRHGGEHAQSNRVIYMTTIDYGWRPFQERVQAARAGLERDVQCRKAMLAGNWALVDDLESKGTLAKQFIKFDYTDVLIREKLRTRDGRVLNVTWPDQEIRPFLDKKGIPFTEKDPETGKILKFGSPCRYYRTYAIAKDELERDLRDGSVDEASWKAEQRNIVDTAVGDVFPNQLIDEVACSGDRYLLSYDECGQAWQEAHPDGLDYVPPVLLECTDPCVLGVDYAPISDFCAFVVIRVGPLAEGDFNPMTHTGRTKWSNVIWAEQHRQMTNYEAAEKVRELRKRYNLVYFHDGVQVRDDWDACRAIGLDMRGGGSGVRDELAYINSKELTPGQRRIIDPLDTDERIQGFMVDQNSKVDPMLDAIMPSDSLNDRLVTYVRGQFETEQLYLPKYLHESARPTLTRETHVGYEASRILVHQLRKVRQEPGKNYRTFYMDGDTAQDRNKKDLFSALLYAAKQLRAHQIRLAQIENTPPPMAAAITRVNRGGGRNVQFYNFRIR